MAVSKQVAPVRAGIQSIEVGARLLSALAEAPAALPLKELAGRAGMSMSKAHRYLVSLGRAGLIAQDGVTGRYDLGALALGLGLAAMGRIDAVRFGLEALPELRDRTNETAVLAIWGDRGPTVIRFEESTHPVRMNVRVGSVLPVARSAIGEMFAAHLPRAAIERLIATDPDHGPADAPALAEAALAEVRARGLSRNVGIYVPAVSAMAAPIRDFQGRIAAVIGVLGHERGLDVTWDGAIARALTATAAGVSARLGHRQ
jgi:DNA-binding IclR family transcriptional regulator